MKTTILIPLGFFGLFAIAQAKDINTERLWTKDSDKNGKLSKEELGDKLWQRMPNTVWINDVRTRKVK